jgi:hypothetical protein
MALSARLARLRYVWGWRLRYWWLDTRSGELARWAAVFLGAFLALFELTRRAVDVALRPEPGEPVQAIVWWVWAIIVLVAAAAASFAMRPKQQKPAAQQGEGPTTEDGQAVVHHFGEVWIENEFLLAWKVVGTEKIKTKGGKK